MKEVFIVIDNSLYMQNQDYTPKRFICEKESIEKVIESSFLQRSDVQISIFPTSFKYQNNFISPTNNKQTLTAFLNKLEIAENFNINYALAILQVFSQQKQNALILIYLGTKTDALKTKLYNEIIKFMNVKTVLFGEAIDLDIKGDVVKIKNNENFIEKVGNFVGMKFEDEEDPIMKMMLEKSKIDY